MISHPVPSRPWQVLAVDLLELQGQEYGVTTEYYSNVFEVHKLVSNTSKEVIDKLKPHMAIHGIPDKIVSDNGPQFSSQEFKKFKDLYGLIMSQALPPTRSQMARRKHGKDCAANHA